MSPKAFSSSVLQMIIGRLFGLQKVTKGLPEILTQPLQNEWPILYFGSIIFPCIVRYIFESST